MRDDACCRRRRGSLPGRRSAESGFAGFDIAAWFGIMVRVEVPEAIVTRLNHEIVQILKSSETQKRLLSFGVDPSSRFSIKEFADFLETDIRRWAGLAAVANLK